MIRMGAALSGGMRRGAGLTVRTPAAAAASWATTMAATTPLWWLRLGEAAGLGSPFAAADVQNMFPGTYYSSGGSLGTNLTLGGAGAVPSNTSVANNGTNYVASIPTTTAFNVTSGTVAGWIKTSTTGAAQTILRRDANNPTNSNRNWILRVGTDNKLLFFCIFGTNPNVASTATYTDGGWHWAVGTWSYNAGANQTTVELWVDGNSQGTAAATGSMPAISAEIMVGAYHSLAGGTYTEQVNGSLDECAMWNRVLTNTEIANLWAARLAA